eukprot:6509354-Alexandrium_andersonii.AAC.1
MRQQTLPKCTTSERASITDATARANEQVRARASPTHCARASPNEGARSDIGHFITCCWRSVRSAPTL